MLEYVTTNVYTLPVELQIPSLNTVLIMLFLHKNYTNNNDKTTFGKHIMAFQYYIRFVLNLNHIKYVISNKGV